MSTRQEEAWVAARAKRRRAQRGLEEAAIAISDPVLREELGKLVRFAEALFIAMHSVKESCDDALMGERAALVDELRAFDQGLGEMNEPQMNAAHEVMSHVIAMVEQRTELRAYADLLKAARGLSVAEEEFDGSSTTNSEAAYEAREMAIEDVIKAIDVIDGIKAA